MRTNNSSKWNARRSNSATPAMQSVIRALLPAIPALHLPAHLQTKMPDSLPIIPPLDRGRAGNCLSFFSRCSITIFLGTSNSNKSILDETTGLEVKTKAIIVGKGMKLKFEACIGIWLTGHGAACTPGRRDEGTVIYCYHCMYCNGSGCWCWCWGLLDTVSREGEEKERTALYSFKQTRQEMKTQSIYIYMSIFLSFFFFSTWNQ